MKNNILFFLICCFFFTLSTPSNLYAQPGDYILVLNKSGNTAWQLNAETGEKVAEYPTDVGPHEVAISPDQSRAVLTNYGDQSNGHTLTVIDLINRNVEKTIDIDPYQRPHGIQWFKDGERVIISAEAQQAVAIVNINTGKIEKAIKTNESVSHMVELSPDEKRVYVPNIASGSTTVLNIPEGSIIKDIPTGEGSEGITLANEGSEVWVSNRAENTLSVIDANTLEITRTLQSRDFPIRAEVAPNGSWVAVSNARSSEISIFDVQSKELLKKISTNSRRVENGIPIGLIFSSDSSRLYVANSQANQIVVIDTGNWEVVDRFQTGETPDGIAYFTIR